MQSIPNDKPAALQTRLANYLSLERNVSIASAAVFLLGLGEELWKKFLPKYLEALGASTPIIGLFGTAEDFFDAIYQYPGGWIADRMGRRRAFLIFVAIASTGYVVYYFASSWPPVAKEQLLTEPEAVATGSWHSTLSMGLFFLLNRSLVECGIRSLPLPVLYRLCPMRTASTQRTASVPRGLDASFSRRCSTMTARNIPPIPSRQGFPSNA